jgi:hypothetical protein
MKILATTIRKVSSLLWVVKERFTALRFGHYKWHHYNLKKIASSLVQGHGQYWWMSLLTVCIGILLRSLHALLGFMLLPSGLCGVA